VIADIIVLLLSTCTLATAMLLLLVLELLFERIHMDVIQIEII